MYYMGERKMMQQEAASSDSTATNPDSIKDLIEQIDQLPTEGIYVAIAVGLLLYIIGWFGGTKHSLKKVIACVVIVTLIGIFSLPIAAYIFESLQPTLGALWAFSVVYLAWCIYLGGMAISLYETLIVTAEEGRPN
jgi:hypothetical protein